MAEKAFTWLEEDSQSDEKIPSIGTAVPDSRFAALKAFLLKNIKVVVIVAAVLAVVIFKLVFGHDDTPKDHRLESVSAVLPIPKGDIIEDGILRPSLIPPSMLSKTQRLELLQPGDADRLVGKLRAKKDIPPNKAVLWSDLELMRPKAPDAPEIHASPIYYGDKK